MRLRQGLLILVSDFFDDEGVESVIEARGRLPHRLLLVQMTRASDEDPSLLADLDGDLIIEDGEHDGAAVTVTPELIARYRAAYRAFAERLDGFAARRGATLIRMDADRDVLDQLMPFLASGRMLP